MTKGRTVRNAVLWVVAGSIALIGAILFVAALGTNSKGEALIENPGTLLGISITSLGGIMVVLLPAMLKLEKNNEAIKEQVQNDHKNPDGTPLNMRDDMDDKHDAILDKLNSLQSGVTLAIELSQGNAADTRGLRTEIHSVRSDIQHNTREMERIARIATGLTRTITDVEARIDRHHPDGGTP